MTVTSSEAGPVHRPLHNLGAVRFLEPDEEERALHLRKVGVVDEKPPPRPGSIHGRGPHRHGDGRYSWLERREELVTNARIQLRSLRIAEEERPRKGVVGSGRH